MGTDMRASVFVGTSLDGMTGLAARGIGHVYVDGGHTVQQFLRAGLIDRITVTRVPILIGSGISIFGALDGDVQLHHVATRAYPSGLVQSEYAVSRFK